MKTPKEKTQDLIEKMYSANQPYTFEPKSAKKCAIISIENEYRSLREQLFNFKACGILTNEKVYLFKLNELIEEEKQMKQELEKM